MKNKKYIEIQDLVEEIIDNRGKTVPTSEFGIPLIATNCIKFSSIFPVFENIRYINENTYKNWFRAHIEPDDILFVNKGTPGRCCIVPNPVSFVVAQDMVGLRFKKHLNPYYMLAVLRSKEIQNTIQNNHVGLVIAHFRKQELIQLQLPILNEYLRNQIGDFYKSVSLKIELNNQINDNLERMAKTLYDYWFVQFDFPDENGKPYKSSGGKMIWNEVLKREIPEGWKVSKLGNVLKTYLGGTPSTKNETYWKGDIPWMNSGEVANFPIISTEQKITQEAIDNSSTRKLKEGTVLLSITRHLRVNILGIQACINQSIVGIEENKFFKKSYIYYLIINDIERLMSLRTGAQQPHINKDIVDNSLIIIPSESVIINYTKKSSFVLDRIINNARQNQQLSQLRDWLLPMLMNGQVKVE